MKMRSRDYKSVILLVVALVFSKPGVYGQVADHLQYVNPFIGTASSNVATKWGSDGGTYPGAVAPSGYIQLSPETRFGKGYHYTDQSICYFSCFGHMSGFPEGSAGRLYIMPVKHAGEDFDPARYNRTFSRKNETAIPGYYKVRFEDDQTVVEATATARTGMFRFTFASGTRPELFIGDTGDLNTVSAKIVQTSNNNTVFNFSEPFVTKRQVKGGWIFSFSPAEKGLKIIELKLSASPVGYLSAQNNIDKEIGNLSFGQLRTRAANEWLNKLSVIDVKDDNEQNKTVFYTALYHSLLIPWVIDDADGNYRGADDKIHQKSGAHQYGAFSPWDTFRSLHPLLTLLYPDKQQDIILSMLDIYRQTGHLPTESMTGNHALPIIADSYLKGITGFSKQLAYAAMRKSILELPFVQTDIEIYNKLGYVPATRSESVTRTVEYAYDDWALSQFAKEVMHDTGDYNILHNKAFNYRNLFNADNLFMLPRNGNDFKINPGMSGYKEGDQWVYSYFVPHNARDLINLGGGNDQFADRLDSALSHNVILFDNETVFHLPYLFNQAGRPDLTQKWLRQIMLSRFSDSPGGLPGNDDLGSMSSWYVFSAIGIYPVCPGRPYYAIGIPVFKHVTLHLPNGKKFIINSNGLSRKNTGVQSVTVNGGPWNQLTLSHKLLTDGGNIQFNLGDKASSRLKVKDPLELSETKKQPDTKVTVYSVSKKIVAPDEPFSVSFTLKNTGATGVKMVKLWVNGKTYASKNCLVASGITKTDTMQCRIYPLGKIRLAIENQKPLIVNVRSQAGPSVPHFKISDLDATAMVRINEPQQLIYSVKNTGGLKQLFKISITKNDSLIFTDTVTLTPGGTRTIKHKLPTSSAGFQKLMVDKEQIRYKVYKDNRESLLLDLSPINYSAQGLINDRSGFNNAGHIMASDSAKSDGSLVFNEHTFVEVPNASSLDHMDQTITVMGWLYPTGNERGLTDVITKGDSHVLQVSDHNTLTFFAGGWGRGDCTVKLPADWNNKWHHIAGVCNGRMLYLYIDGMLAGSTITDSDANLSVTNKWTLGRNEEFPNERIFHGRMNKVQVFKAALSADEIHSIFESGPAALP
ncbi:hypothetical protein FO440_12175 [Mucilaginibacter corticis]|uniref:LamG-like jellyroll fold domain-containing protein n=1 Tax=Mucilaginibacter corticis TaxID=2597670 RepID=A0A556MKY9_9SPHI|nr:GH92 family glycosyl hydrolase [Mucilaginibacter corticis]TSJ40505.1 hypothetical protein FO440_12175 [Mucilaginibacter corticis]